MCTAFCLEEDSSLGSRQYGLDRIIITLPFNWGSAVPDRITLEDGTEVAVPCDGDNYGCGGENSDGNRIRRRENSERRKVKDKLETIPFLAFSEKGRTTTLKVSVTKTSFPQTRRPTTQRMRTQRRTTQIKKTTTKSRKAKPVQFSLTDFSSIKCQALQSKTNQEDDNICGVW